MQPPAAATHFPNDDEKNNKKNWRFYKFWSKTKSFYKHEVS